MYNTGSPVLRATSELLMSLGIVSFSAIRWWTISEKPGMLKFMGLQSIRHDLAAEQQQCYLWYIGGSLLLKMLLE